MSTVADELRVDAARRVSGELLRGVRVFVAEDEVLIAMEIEAILEDNGARVVGPSHTLSQAIERAAGDDISVAVLDLRLGRDSIAPVARLLVERQIPFLFYSGQTAVDPMRSEWPDAVIVAKPASASELVEAVASLLERSRTACALAG